MINVKQLLIMMVSVVGVVHQGKAQQHVGEQIQLNWHTAPQYDGKDNLDLKIVLKNISTKTVHLKTWDLWFNSMFPVVAKDAGAYAITNENGNLFRLAFSNQVIAPDDSLIFDYQTLFPIANISTVPNGFYFRDKTDINKYYAIGQVVYSPIRKSAEQERDFYASLYAKNERLNKAAGYPLVFPTPKSIHLEKGSFPIDAQLSFYMDSAFGQRDIFVAEMESFLRTSFVKHTPKAAKLSIKQDKKLGTEAYRLKVAPTGISIYAATDTGVFYAIQSLKSMIPAIAAPVGTRLSLPYVFIEDEPRYPYRGFMLDIVRNFKSKAVILKYLDVMAAYKLNVFHLHLIDDEGWRIAIPSLPELTEIGAKRAPSFSDKQSLHPAYGSGATDTAQHYLSRADFIAILKYAKDRFITVVPEIETPGHARAAIKSMEARYHRLVALGKQEEAEEYLLHDFEDRSVYNSAQNFNDNILNPALPSVYTFISKVLDEFKSMYVEAGVNFTTVSLGGDEVPSGVWKKSPKIQQLMQKEGFTSVNQVWPYYISRINALCLSKGLRLAGWEEIGMVNKGEGMMVNPDMDHASNMQLDVWNNVIGGGQEDLAYRLANAGYPTVLLSASNMYFDMMWNTNFEEPGLKWATYADLYHSYSLLPEAYFANIDTYYSGKDLGKDFFKNRVRLTEAGKRNLIGIKGGLFAETVHSASKLDYMVFPRFFALAERAWSPKRAYESEEAFTSTALEQDYLHFVNRIGRVDLPKLADRFAFRLPAVGLQQQGDTLLANIEYPNFNIYYTIDGTVPSLRSMKYAPEKGVTYMPNHKYVFAVVEDSGRVGQLTYFN